MSLAQPVCAPIPHMPTGLSPGQASDPDYFPGFAVAIPLGIQHVLAMFVSNLTPAIIVAGAAGFGFGSPDPSELIYMIQMSMLFAGIATLLQTIGLGPIGLMAVESAYVMGAHVVYAIDPIAERRAMAEQSGAITLHPDEALERIKADTKGRKLDCVVEVVGSDATVDFALRLVRPRGTVSVIGVQQSRRFAFPLERAFAAGLTFRIGTCSVPEELPALFPLVQSGRLKPERTITHRMPLSEGAEAYRLFEAREAGALKMVLTPD